MQRYPKMKVVVAHGKASWMEEVLEKMEASTRTIPLLHYYPVRTDTEELWKEGQVMLGFDAEERLIQKLPEDFAEKIVWGSRYPQHDTTSALEAIETLVRARVGDSSLARMFGGNAAAQFGVALSANVRSLRLKPRFARPYDGQIARLTAGQDRLGIEAMVERGPGVVVKRSGGLVEVGRNRVTCGRGVVAEHFDRLERVGERSFPKSPSLLRMSAVAVMI